MFDSLFSDPFDFDFGLRQTYAQIVRKLQERPIADKATRERMFVALGAQLAS